MDDKILRLVDTEFDMFIVKESVIMDLELEEDSIDMDMLDEPMVEEQLTQLFVLQFLKNQESS